MSGTHMSICCFGAKFFFICGSVKLQNRSSASRIQWWNSYKIDIPIPKGRIGRTKGVMILLLLSLA